MRHMEYILFGGLCAWLCLSGCRTSSVSVMAGSGGGVQLGPVDIELRTHGYRLPCFVHNNQFYVVGQKEMPYSIWIRNRTARRLEVVVAVDGRDVITGRPQKIEHRGYILNPHRYVHITGYRTSLQTVAGFRFTALHRAYSSRMGSSWYKVGSIQVSVFSEHTREPLMAQPLVQRSKQKKRLPQDLPSILRQRKYPQKPPRWKSLKVSPRYNQYRSQRSRKSYKYPGKVSRQRSQQRYKEDVAPSRQKLDSRSSHGYHHPAPNEGLGTAFGRKKWAPARYTQFIRTSSAPDYRLKILYNNCAGYRYLRMCTPWCPCGMQSGLTTSIRTVHGRFAPAP